MKKQFQLIIEILQKYKLLIIFIFVLTIILIIGVQNYSSLKTNNAYAIGKTKKSIYTKGYKREVEYNFYLGSQSYTGWATDLRGLEREIKIPGYP